MEIETLGHAGLLIRDDAGQPILFTDPWVRGSCYWRSWWLQHYPSASQLAELQRVSYCFVTHEHPDHFHTASIRALGKSVHYLAPELPHEHIASYLTGLGYTASVVPAFTWTPLHPDVLILSIPLFNDDSALLIDTPSALIVNLNDSKPGAGQLRQLRAWLDRAVPRKRRILLSSYSPASVVNSFLRGGRRVSLKAAPDYVRYVGWLCRLLGADDYLPFASQVVFRRTDSDWANAFKVGYDDLRAHWGSDATRLLPPYARMQLGDGSYTFVHPDQYDAGGDAVLERVREQQALDRYAELTDGDLARLGRKLNASRWLLAALFPRGIGFRLDRSELRYSGWSGRLARGPASGDVTLQMPTQAFKDAVEYGHVGDMGTTMFTMVQLNTGIDPRRVYLFFFLMSLHDYGHTTSLGGWFSWGRRVLGLRRWRIPTLAQP